MPALGFIETKGLLPAVEAADAMLKAADVRLLEKNLVGGGLVSVSVCGEVSAVQAAVGAGTAAVGRITGATLVSRLVIARPDAELGGIIAVEPPRQDESTPPATPRPTSRVTPPAAAADRQPAVAVTNSAASAPAAAEPVKASAAPRPAGKGKEARPKAKKR